MTQEIQIPFEGFYESVIDSIVDDYILSLFDFEGTGDTNLIPENWYNHFSYNDKMLNAICVEYVSRFQEYLSYEHSIDIDLKYKNIESPKYYNFSTDRIFCEISIQDAVKLYNTCKTDVLEQVIKDRHSSRPGFISFYSNDINASCWQNVHDMDHNHLMTVLIAAIISSISETGYVTDREKHFKDHYEPDYWTLYEDLSGNGQLDNMIFSNMSKECQDMANQAYDDWCNAQKQTEMKGL